MTSEEWFSAGMGGHASDEFSLEEARIFIVETVARFPSDKPVGVKASISLVRKGLGETFCGLPVSPQPDWYPGEKLEVHFSKARRKGPIPMMKPRIPTMDTRIAKPLK